MGLVAGYGSASDSDPASDKEEEEEDPFANPFDVRS